MPLVAVAAVVTAAAAATSVGYVISQGKPKISGGGTGGYGTASGTQVQQSIQQQAQANAAATSLQISQNEAMIQLADESANTNNVLASSQNSVRAVNYVLLFVVGLAVFGILKKMKVF
jgi:hypothetical protein